MTLFWQVILFSLMGGIFSTIGGIVLLARPDKLRKLSFWLLAFAAGTLFSVAFFDLLPEAFANADESGYAALNVLQALFGGLVGLFVIEGLLFRIHHHHDDTLITNLEHPHRDEPLHTPILLAIGDSIHNFVDGVAIGAAFLAGAPVGFLTTLAVVAHEVPQEISEFSVMAASGWTNTRIIVVNLLSALLSTAGAIGIYLYRDALSSILWAPIAITAGIFIYIAVADIMPQLYEEHHRDRVWKMILVFLAGVVLVYGMGMLIDGQKTEATPEPMYAILYTA